MTHSFSNLRNLGNKIHVSIPKDEEGYIGRECAEKGCEGYFKIKPGTGLKGEGLPCHCAYCGHSAPHDQFSTKEQIEYTKSIAIRKTVDALHKELKSLEFEIKPKGPFGIGISMKVQQGRPMPIRYYREKVLETKVTCEACTLDYAVYGVFAFCPDCGKHNSLQILRKNLDLARKQLVLSEQQDKDFQRYLIEDALENCVSAFDGFARESCRVRADKSSDPQKATNISFQNLNRAEDKIKALFGPDIKSLIDVEVWRKVNLGFQRRHLIAHRAGVVDTQYLKETGEDPKLLGRRISIATDDVLFLAESLMVLGEKLLAVLPS